MNKTYLVGEVSNVSAKANDVTRFTIKTTRGKSTSYISCVSFRKEDTELLADGKRVSLTGRIQTGNYTNKEGQRVYTTDVAVTSLRAVERGEDMNLVILMGRLTRDPMVTYSSGETPVAIARFTTAVDRRTKKSNTDEQTADFISTKALGRLGEFTEKYLHKGVKILLTGYIQTGSYTNKGNQKIYTTDVLCDDIEFAESKSASNNAAAGNSSVSVDTADFMDIPDGLEDEGLPFN